MAGFTLSMNFPVFNAYQERNLGNYGAFVTRIPSNQLPGAAVLSVTKTHVGNFTRSQTGATYTVTVSNLAGAGSTIGAVAVTDTVPSGLTLVSMAGAGWTCTGNSCSRSDSLAGGYAYPAITVTLNVAPNVASPLANVVNVSGGGSPGASATDSTVINVPPTAVSVAPALGSGSTQTFTFVYFDANGAVDLNAAFAMINTAVSADGGCWLLADPVQNSVRLFNDAAGAWSAPLPLGTSGSLQTSRCTLNGAASSGVLAGNTFTLNLALSFPVAFAGSKNVYGYAAQNSGNLASGWVQLGTWMVTGPSNQPPQVISVTPALGNGSTQIFRFSYSDANGGADLNAAFAMINTAVSANGGCWVWADPVQNLVRLFNDASGTWSSPLPLGASGLLRTSRCTINGSGSSGAIAGNTFTLNLALSFAVGFAGSKNVYGYAAQNSGNLVSGWVQLGTWTVSGASNQPPQVISVTPASGGGASQTFTFAYSDANGAMDLNAAFAMINPVVSGDGGCWLWADPVQNSVRLFNDAAGTWSAALPLGTSGSLQTSRCTLNGSASSGVIAGNTFTLNLALSFPVAFAGSKNVYGYAAQNSGNLASGWVQLGTWVVTGPSNQPPQAVSVAPALGNGSTQTFRFSYSDANGGADLNAAFAMINTAVSANGGCWVWADPVQNSVRLFNDASGTWSSPLPLGTSGLLQTSRCTINGSGSSGAIAGNTFTLNLALSFAVGFAGSKNVYGYAAQNSGNLVSGWVQLGTWTN